MLRPRHDYRNEIANVITVENYLKTIKQEVSAMFKNCSYKTRVAMQILLLFLASCAAVTLLMTGLLLRPGLANDTIAQGDGWV